MAQLIKLQDYVSRYQKDLKRYSNQFVRLKKVQWHRMKQEWENGVALVEWVHEETEIEQKDSWLSRLFKRDEAEIDLSDELESDSHTGLEDRLGDFQVNMSYHPKTIDELKKMYLDQLFHFQLQWASSTLMEKSHLDNKYIRDTFLRLLTQRLPDNLLLFYRPIIQVKKAPLELEIVLLTPTETLCICLLEAEDMAAFVANEERFWTKKWRDQEQKVLNPMIALNRMESVLKQLYQSNEVELPIRKVIVSRNGYIDFPGNSYGLKLIDKRSFEEWFMQLRNISIPLKHMQMKAAEALLAHTQTTSFSRVGWESEIEENE
ncbi:NERD domain-containing protein [Paenisporosarcina cavernae]|uniref:NERD domain-containing protein n=1 Tax=Paenisporosarcina cavernae TaxID=2320858 RepID=A0A385YT79_9BACL|nr:NERD domain-containing protein [Paenisporosarcina cavernae]AYC29886.1 NERD domain-containing protein [Paenisporosarcina cavernae]